MIFLIAGALSCFEEQIHKLLAGHQVYFMPIESEQIPVAEEAVEAVICNGLFLHHSIEKFTNLRYIQLTSAGYDRVPMDYIKEHHIVIHNARGVYSIPMAEYAISAVLNIYKQWDFFRENQRNHVWIKNRHLVELWGKTVCIVGCGSVGNECARRFQVFGCKVIGVTRTPRVDVYYDDVKTISELKSIIPKADILILTLPLTEETRYIINEEVLLLLKNETILVNMARGAVLELKALMDVLKQKDVIAVLDVFEDEPLDASEVVWDMDNIIVTPHNSFVGERNTERLFEIVEKNFRDYINQRGAV